MNGFIFTPRYNGEPNSSNPAYCIATGPAHGVQATHACDATGLFRPSAHLFSRVNSITNPVFTFDNSLHEPQRRAQIFEAMNDAQGLFQIVAYFGHGWRDGLSTAAIGISHLPRLTEILLRKCAMDVKIMFFGCSAGRRGGFAQRLAETLTSVRATVLGHTGDGHATTYPYVMRYPEGRMLIEDTDPLWSTWRGALHGHEQIWLHYPFMTDAQLRTRLDEIRNAPPVINRHRHHR